MSLMRSGLNAKRWLSLWVFCAYLFASFTALAEVLGSKVCLSRDKYNTMGCLESEQVKQCITTDWKAARVHVLPMMQLTFRV